MFEAELTCIGGLGFFWLSYFALQAMLESQAAPSHPCSSLSQNMNKTNVMEHYGTQHIHCREGCRSKVVSDTQVPEGCSESKFREEFSHSTKTKYSSP